MAASSRRPSSRPRRRRRLRCSTIGGPKTSIASSSIIPRTALIGSLPPTLPPR